MVTPVFNFKTDVYNAPLLLKDGLTYDYHRSIGNMGKCFYLYDDGLIETVRDKPITLKVKMKDLNNINIYNSFLQFMNTDLVTYNNNSQQYLTDFGRTDRFGEKYVVPFANANDVNGIWIKNENTLYLYNNLNVEVVYVNETGL